jgi:hypothetical protein
MSEEEQKKFDKQRTFPINQLDSAWLAAEPDYTLLQQTFYESAPNPVSVFSLFNSGIRLSKLGNEEAKICEYDLITAAFSIDLGLYDFGVSVFFDVAAVLETRQSKAGFRTEAMNKVSQEIRNIQETQKKNVFGGKKQDES